MPISYTSAFKKILTDNGVNSDAIKTYNVHKSQETVNIKATWILDVYEDENEYLGNSSKQSYHYGSKNAYHQAIATIKNNALNDFGWQDNFINNIGSEKTDVFLNKNFRDIGVYGSASYERDCSQCSGRGVVICPSCWGSLTVMRDEYDARVQGNVRRSVTCERCRLSGHIKCGQCDGYKVYTVVNSVKAYAKLKITIGTKDNYLNNYLLGCENREYLEILSFDSYRKEDSRSFMYNFTAEYITFDTTINNRSYSLSMIVLPNKQWLFVKTANIFDNLISNEINELASMSSNSLDQNYLGKFSKIVNNPIMHSLISGFRAEEHEDETIKEHIKNKCVGLISDNAASTIASSFNNIYNRISPVSYNHFYENTSNIFILLMILWSMFLAENGYSLLGDSFLMRLMTFGLLGLLASMLIVVLPVIFIAETKSRKAHAANQSMLPPEFRRKHNDEKSMDNIADTFAPLWITSIVIGLILAFFDKAPATAVVMFFWETTKSLSYKAVDYVIYGYDLINSYLF